MIDTEESENCNKPKKIGRKEMTEREEKFTPGPWILDGCEVQIPQMNGRLPTMEERLANARLIASAPEMYELLKQLHGALASVPVLQSEIDKILKKARGEKC